MTIKTWVLGRVQKTGGLFARSDLPRREPAPSSNASAGGSTPQGPVTRLPDNAMASAPHLGFYAALIGAIRDELEHFVVSHVRLHLAIADHDRFVLTSIHVSCADDAQARQLLHQFMHEFKPEQVKRYLAREVIGALPNAAAIDLTQFAGLLDADMQMDPGENDEYGELLAALRTDTPAPSARAYRVSIVGRWTERDNEGHAASPVIGPPGATPSTPLAGQRCDFDIEDGDGRRRVVLHGVVAGRRYLIGKDAGCDIRVNGTYTSRRHGEIWLDNGAWHVTDAGSTNGIRVESESGAVKRCVPGAGQDAITLSGGARIVLSANAEGAASDYPSIALRSSADMASRATPIAGAVSPKTPLTPIHSGKSKNGLLLTARSAEGVRKIELWRAALPVTVGRSRDQTLVIGRAHELVSGHHLDIVAVDDLGVQVVVHGDNGVIVEGVSCPVGSRFTWRAGQSMVLGAVQADGCACTLALSRGV